MKRYGILLGSLLLAASLTACAPSAQPSESSYPSLSAASAPVQSREPVASAHNLGPQVMEMEIFVQLNSGAEEGYEPTIRLLENGNFEFATYHYDGVVILSGTYEAIEGGYRLSPQETQAQGVMGSNLEEFTLELTDSGVIYNGPEQGVTPTGAQFEKQ